MLLAALIGEMLCFGQPAAAQQAASADKPPVAKTAVPPKPERVPVVGEAPGGGGEIASISVVAERPTNRIDRQVYDVKADVANTNSTAAETLNNVPSVSVDPDGSVSLRGSTNVQIMIDGKPSAMMQGDNRAAALAGIPSEDIESIEVINNPGAQFGNDGGGGPILNIVMKRNRRAGGFGVVNANAGSAGRYNTALSGNFHQGRIGIQGGLNFRHDGRSSDGEATRERIDSVTGVATRSAQSFRSDGLSDAAGFNSTLTYNLGDKDTLAANASYTKRTDDQRSTDHYLTFGDDNAAVRDYLRATSGSGASDSYSVGGRLDHKGDQPGETLKLDLRVSSSVNTSDRAYSTVYSVPSDRAESRSAQDYTSENRIVDFSGDYERPGEQGLVKLGYKVADHQSEFDTLYLDIDPLTLAENVNTVRTNRFKLDEANLALYASYQWRLNEYWGVQAGLRTEYTHIDIEQLTSQVNATNAYINYIPSFFASYKASDEATVRFSYAHRLRRANAGELNPFVVYRDDFNQSSGNPRLMPMQTDSFELGYETKTGRLDTNLRAYYRADRDAIRYRRYFINDTVLLTTRENGGEGRASGLEFSLGGKVTPEFSINTSGNLAILEQTLLDSSGVESTHSARSLSMKGRFNYQLTPDDHLQLMLNAQGKTLAGQGYREPVSTANFSIRHKLSPSLSLVMNVTDMFNSNTIETITESETLNERNVRRFPGRLFYVGLSYRIGGSTPKPAASWGKATQG